MGRVYYGLCSTEGDRLGHLVRAVQMLRSYGGEAEIDEYSDVVNLALRPEAPPSFACVVGGSTCASLQGLRSICRETEWALGDQPETLSVWLLEPGGGWPEPVPGAFAQIRRGQITGPMMLAMPAAEFARLCDWGQQLFGEGAGVAGEWPSATGP